MWVLRASYALAGGLNKLSFLLSVVLLRTSGGLGMSPQADFELSPCSFSALFQLRTCLKTAWLRVLNASVNLSRPTNFLTQDSSHFRSTMDRVPAVGLECLLGELLHQQNRSWKRRELQRRSRVLRVRLSEDEYQLLKAFAESHGTTMSGMFRYVIRAMRQLDEQRETINGARAAVTEP